MGVDVVFFEPLLLKRQNAGDLVHAPAQLAETPGAPGPQLGGDIVQDGDAEAMGGFSDVEIQSGRVDKHNDIGAIGAKILLDTAKEAEIESDLADGVPEHGAAVNEVFEQFAAGRGHVGATQALTGQVGYFTAQEPDDGGGVAVATGLGSAEEYGASGFSNHGTMGAVWVGFVKVGP